MPKKNNEPARKITENELIQIEAWSAVRVPMEQMATLLKMSKDVLEDLYKKNDAVRHAIDGGRSKASSNIRSTLFQLSMGHDAYLAPEVKDPKTGKVITPEHIVPARPPKLEAIKFWCQTQEGFKVQEELTIHNLGANGKEQLTDEELAKRTKETMDRLASRKRGK